MYKITKEEIEVERAPSEIYDWVFSSFDKFTSKEEKTSLRLLTYDEIKVFVEESYPLALFCKHFFTEDSSTKITQKLGNQSYDAEVSGCDHFEYIEITMAKDGYDEKLRNAELDKNGSVPGFGGITITGGSKASGKRVVSFENIAVLHEGIKEEQKELILKRVDEKSKIKYPSNTILIVAFDNFTTFKDGEDIDELKTFMEDTLAPKAKNFSNLFLIGLSGQVFLSVKSV